jgi:hypothetical protein
MSKWRWITTFATLGHQLTPIAPSLSHSAYFQTNPMENAVIVGRMTRLLSRVGRKDIPLLVFSALALFCIQKMAKMEISPLRESTSYQWFYAFILFLYFLFACVFLEALEVRNTLNRRSPKPPASVTALVLVACYFVGVSVMKPLESALKDPNMASYYWSVTLSRAHWVCVLMVCAYTIFRPLFVVLKQLYIRRKHTRSYH